MPRKFWRPSLDHTDIEIGRVAVAVRRFLAGGRLAVREAVLGEEPAEVEDQVPPDHHLHTRLDVDAEHLRLAVLGLLTDAAGLAESAPATDIKGLALAADNKVS